MEVFVTQGRDPTVDKCKFHGPQSAVKKVGTIHFAAYRHSGSAVVTTEPHHTRSSSVYCTPLNEYLFFICTYCALCESSAGVGVVTWLRFKNSILKKLLCRE